MSSMCKLIILINLFMLVTCEMKKSWKKSAIFDENLVEDINLPKVAKFTPITEEPQPVLDKKLDKKISVNTQKPRFRSTYIAKNTSFVNNHVKEVKSEPQAKIDEKEQDIGMPDIEYFADDDMDVADVDDEDETEYAEAKLDEDDFSIIEELFEEVSNDVSQNQGDVKEEGDRKEDKLQHYDIGPMLNLTIDEPKNIVNVKLNESMVRSLFTGRGKKNNMLNYAMPLFIIPFLIQSALIPFMLSTVKIFLFKSFFAGKIAIFLLLLGAFKNMNKESKGQKDVYVNTPERRYEPLEPYGYQAVGRPTNWVH